MKRRLALLLTSLLWLYIVAALASLSLRFQQQWDVSSAGRNTLTQASQDLLASMPDPVMATAWVFPSADTRADIQARFDPYLRHRDNFKLRFRDPASDPETVRSLGISQSGEVILEYQGRRENLTVISEPDITAALQRLSFAGDAFIGFLSGHGERDIHDEGQSGYSTLAAILQQKGLRANRINLATNVLPEELDLLVMAAPQRPVTAGEIAQILTWLKQGGQLLWLLDPKLPYDQELAISLGVQVLDGTVIYQDYELIGSGHPAMAIVANYPQHPAFEKLTDMTAFAGASALTELPGSGWQAEPVLRSVPRSWLETGPLQDQLAFDQGQDTMGPLNLAYMLRRGEQRAAVFADSDFLSNAYLTQLGNRPLAVAVFQWLLSRDGQINVDIPPAPDAQLSLSPLATKILALLFVLLLPALFLSTGLLHWWRRRRAS
ncbi:MAG: GldG family protein [Oceanococcus sp.]